MDRRVVISGCSGGGKSTLLEALRERGFSVVEEPGRRIVREELASNGSALPWIDLAAFARRAISAAASDWEANANPTVGSSSTAALSMPLRPWNTPAATESWTT